MFVGRVLRETNTNNNLVLRKEGVVEISQIGTLLRAEKKRTKNNRKKRSKKQGGANARSASVKGIAEFGVK